MKKILEIIFLVFLWCNVSNSASMISLQEYVKSNSDYLNDPITKIYVLKRCAASYLYAAEATKESSPETSQELAKAYNKAIGSANKISITEMKLTKEVALKSLKIDIDNMIKYYKIDGKDFFIRTGYKLLQNYIGEDLLFCKGVVEKLDKLN